jgi:hypothetical protein
MEAELSHNAARAMCWYEKGVRPACRGTMLIMARRLDTRQDYAK